MVHAIAQPTPTQLLDSEQHRVIETSLTESASLTKGVVEGVRRRFLPFMQAAWLHKPPRPASQLIQKPAGSVPLPDKPQGAGDALEVQSQLNSQLSNSWLHRFLVENGPIVNWGMDMRRDLSSDCRIYI